MIIKNILALLSSKKTNDDVSSQSPANTDTPVFFTQNQERAMDWEARMTARAMRRLNIHVSISKQHGIILKDMKEKYARNPDALKTIESVYNQCMDIQDDSKQIKFENDYVAQKVSRDKKMRQKTTAHR